MSKMTVVHLQNESKPNGRKNSYKKLSCCCDIRSYCICRTVQLQNVDWNSRGQHEYLRIHSFKLKSTFDNGSLLFIPVNFFNSTLLTQVY